MYAHATPNLPPKIVEPVRSVVHHGSGQRRVPISSSILSADRHVASLTVLDSLMPSPRPGAVTSGEKDLLAQHFQEIPHGHENSTP